MLKQMEVILQMINRKQKRFRIATAVLMALLFVLFSGTVLAVDLTIPVELGIVPAGSEFLEDLNEADIVYDLYKVADATEISGQDTYGFAVREFYTSEAYAVEISPEMDAESWRTQAAHAFVKALTENDTPLIWGQTSKADERFTTADDGSQLLPGLYLLVARGADAALQDPSVYADTTDPEQPKSIAYSGNYIYTFAPVLIALPYTSPEINEEIHTTADGEWNYSVTVHLKPERTERYGSISIVKKLLTYKKGTAADFVFTVRAEVYGSIVFEKEVTISFDENSERIQELVIDGIPIGATVTVEEKTPQDGYVLVQSENDPQVITAEIIPEFLFANDYEEVTPPDTGDHVHLWLYILLAAVSGLGLLYMGGRYLFRKRS